MKIGTKSILFGAHQFLVHPLFVVWAWWRLYGCPTDPRLWMAFFLHDLGYWGRADMDGTDGERHPEWAAQVMGRLFGRQWHDFCLYHSRFLAKRHGQAPSKLCMADKFCIVLTPAWIYLPMVRLTGELAEYMRLALEAKYKSMGCYDANPWRWYGNVQAYLRWWVGERRDGKEDVWTPTLRR